MLKSNKKILSNSRCKFCGKEKKLIKAHIIPKKFYLALRDNEKYVEFNMEASKYKELQCGAYDKNILCSDCDDNILGEFDKEGYQILLSDYRNYKNVVLSQDCKIYYLNKNDFNYNNFRKFIISILWRASISNLKEWSDINLYSYEKKAYEILKGIKEHKKLFKILIHKSPKEDVIENLVAISRNQNEKFKIYYITMAGYIISVIPNPKKLTPDYINKFEPYFLSPDKINIIETSTATRNIRQNFVEHMLILQKRGFKFPKPKNVD